MIERRLRADPTDGRRNDLRVATEWLAGGTGAGFENCTISDAQPIAGVASAIIEWLRWPGEPEIRQPMTPRATRPSAPRARRQGSPHGQEAELPY
jgi:hypothetical protein